MNITNVTQASAEAERNQDDFVSTEEWEDYDPLDDWEDDGDYQDLDFDLIETEEVDWLDNEYNNT